MQELFEQEDVCFSVWRKSEQRDRDEAVLLSLTHPDALTFFLEALARGATSIGTGPFWIVATAGSQRLGQGLYQVIDLEQYAPDPDIAADPEPVKLLAIAEYGQMIGVMQTAWREMLVRTIDLHASVKEAKSIVIEEAAPQGNLALPLLASPPPCGACRDV